MKVWSRFRKTGTETAAGWTYRKRPKEHGDNSTLVMQA